MDPADPLLLRTDKGSTVRCRGLSLYPPDDPVGYAVRRAVSAEIPPRTLVFVPSVGLGHGLTELLARLPESSAVICVESDQRIMALALAEGLPGDPRLIVLRTADEASVAAALARLGPGRFRRVVRVPLSAGYRLDPSFYERLHGMLASEIRTYWQNRMTLIGMGSLWVRNLFDNLPLLAEERDFRSLSTELPVVVAGAGPSLDEAIPMLAGFRGSFALVAVDTALPALSAAGLIPDLVVVLEAQAVNLLDFLPYRGPRVTIACDLASHPSVPRLARGSVFLFSSAFAPLSLLRRMEEAKLLPFPFPALGSVGVAAVHAALALTPRSVLVTGLDFGFPDGRTHARGTPLHLAALATSRRCRPIGQDAYAAVRERPLVQETDKRGRPFMTDAVLRSYRDQLRRRLEPEAGRVRDAGATGLAFGGAPVTAGELSALLPTAPPAGPRLLIRDRGPRDRAAIGAFLEAEKRLLSDAEKTISGLLSRAAAVDPSHARPVPGVTADETALFSSVDHAYAHFPDQPDLTALDRSFLARSLVAVRYYSRRLERSAGGTAR